MDPNDMTRTASYETGSSERRLIGRYQVKRLLAAEEWDRFTSPTTRCSTARSPSS